MLPARRDARRCGMVAADARAPGARSFADAQDDGGRDGGGRTLTRDDGPGKPRPLRWGTDAGAGRDPSLTLRITAWGRLAQDDNGGRRAIRESPLQRETERRRGAVGARRERIATPGCGLVRNDRPGGGGRFVNRPYGGGRSGGAGQWARGENGLPHQAAAWFAMTGEGRRAMLGAAGEEPGGRKGRIHKKLFSSGGLCVILCTREGIPLSTTAINERSWHHEVHFHRETDGVL